MKINYRPEIDGLRAFAVGAVILYHAQISVLGLQPFKGGFIGVDIFFTISGYLITKIILKEIKTTGKFSFRNFYERRIRRILPALLLVMLISLPFAWMYLLPNNFIDFSKSLLYSLGFSSNFYFWHSGLIYGSQDGLLKPLLHTWSLSIEEQFYIIFPITLFFTVKYFKNYLIYILIIFFLISLGLSEWVGKNYSSLNFYILPTRGWELIAGSILAYFEIFRGHRSKNKKLNVILPSVGLFLISYSIIFFNDKMFHPSINTLLPIIGVCLIIWFANKDEVITKLLSSKLLVGTGLISYSLYLWHYPIFAFERNVDYFEGGIASKIIIGLLIIFASIISYYLVERPFRNKKNKFKRIILLILFSFFILIFLNTTVIMNKGYQSRLPEILKTNLLIEPWNLLKNSDNEICHGKLEGCKFNVSSNKKIYAIGDSHMSTLSFNLKNRIINNDFQFITSRNSCMFFPGFNGINKYTNKLDKNCNDEYFSKLSNTLSKENNSIMIFAGRFPLYFNKRYFDNKEGGVEGGEWGLNYIATGKYTSIQDSFKKEVLGLSKKNKIVLIYPIPEVGWKVDKKIWNNRNNKMSTKVNLNQITTSYNVYKNRSKSSFDLLDSIQSENIYRVYPHRLFCDTLVKDRCLTHDNKNIFYYDYDHPSLKGAEMINDLIIKEIEKLDIN